MDKNIFKYMNDMGADKKLSLQNQTFLIEKSSMLHSCVESYDGGDCGFCTGQFDDDTVV